MKLVWTRLAVADLLRVHDHVAAENEDAADAMMRRIRDCVAILASHPGLGRDGRVEGTRELIVAGTPFIVPYREKSDRIEVLAVMHGVRRWPETF